jgi:ATP-dependent helicase/nuclease subunit B
MTGVGVAFIIGRAGTGKTAAGYQRTIEACKRDPLGEPILWVVPRQATFQVERDLCCNGEIPGFFRVQVVSLELLCRQTLAEVGGAAAPEVSSLGRQMILGRMLRKHRHDLKFFQAVADQPGTADEIGAALEELDRTGADLGILAKSAATPALAQKLLDLERIQRAYDDFLGRQSIDPQRRARQAEEAIATSRRLASATVYLDGFLHFTRVERRLLVALGRVCREMQIAITMDVTSNVLRDVNQLPEDLSLFNRMETEYRNLRLAFAEAGVKVAEPELLHETRRFESPALRQIEQWGTGREQGADGLELIEAPDKRAEVETAALRARELAAAGWRWRHIAVLARDIEPYHDLIEAIFTEHGIPHFVDQRRTAGHHPLVQLVRSALAAAEEGFSEESMVGILKSGLCGLNSTDADELENYVLIHGIRGPTWTSPANWTGRRQEALAQSADALRRRMVKPLAAFATAMKLEQPVRQQITALMEMLQQYQVRQTLQQWTNDAQEHGRLEQAAEDEQVWAELLLVIQQMGDLLGNETMTLSEFRSALEGALERLDLAIAPATVDQVLIGQVDRTRTPAVRAVIVLGLSDGQFPLPSQPTKLLSDEDRRALAGLAELEPDARRRGLDEQFLGYTAFTRASQKLIVLRPAGDEKGRALHASSLWRKLQDMVSLAQVTLVQRQDQIRAADVASPRQLVGGLLQWARLGGDQSADGWPALYQWLIARPRRGDAIDAMRQDAWKSLSYENQAAIPAALAAQMFGKPLWVEARQLETFAACPFQHLAKYGLRLRARATPGMSGGETWRLCRDALDHVLREARDWAQLSDTQVHELVGTVLDEAMQQSRDQWMLGDGRSHYLGQWLTHTLVQVVRAQRAAEQRGQFKPLPGRQKYGDKQQSPPLRLGADLLISGEIDRVDEGPDGTAVIYDYHLTARALNLNEVYHGLSLRLVTDALAWKRSRPVAVLAASMLRKTQDGNPDDAVSPEDERFDLQVKPRGIIEENYVPRLDDRLANGPSDVVAAYVKQDGSFGNRDKNDVASQAEFTGLLNHVRNLLQRIAKDILLGRVAVRPYKLGNQTPCPQCKFIDVCRFEPSQGYVLLNVMKRSDILAKVGE